MVCCYYCKEIHRLIPVVRVLNNDLFIKYYRVCCKCKVKKLKYVFDKQYYIEVEETKNELSHM